MDEPKIGTGAGMAASADSAVAAARPQPKAVVRIGHFRWLICAVLFFGVTNKTA